MGPGMCVDKGVLYFAAISYTTDMKHVSCARKLAIQKSAWKAGQLARLCEARMLLSGKAFSEMVRQAEATTGMSYTSCSMVRAQSVFLNV